MLKNKFTICTLSVFCLFSGESVMADVSVWLTPLSSSVTVGKINRLSLYINASEPIVGWGVDLDVSDPAAMSIVSISSPLGWVSVSETSDGDGLAAIAFPASVAGNNIFIASITYQALKAGSFTVSVSVTAGDSGEGFVLAAGGFSPATFAVPLSLTFDPSGACCFADGSCLNNFKNFECLLIDGAYKGDGTTCLGDADNDGVDDVCPCVCDCDVNDDGFCDSSDVVFIDNCISNPSGAGCDMADVNCDGKIDEFDTCATTCIMSGDGNVNTCCGPSTICGACCDNGCSIESTCNGIQLQGLYCSDSQACRINGTPDTCQDLDIGCCDSLGGQSLGSATICGQAGACCLPDGSCAEIAPLSCSDQGGLSGGAAICDMSTTCQLGCCLLGNSCSRQTEAQCDGQGGDFRGDGSLCGNNGCVLAPAVPSPPHDITKDRYLSLDLSTNISLPVAFQVTRVGGSEIKYIGCSLTDRGSEGKFAWLQDAPEFCIWTDSVIHVTGCEIVPGQIYHIATTTDDVNFTNALTLSTTPQPSPRFYGDVVGQISGNSWTSPNLIVNGNDIIAIVQGFQLRPSAPQLARTDLGGQLPDGLINASDILLVVFAFAGKDYPFAAPACCSGACNFIDPNAPFVASLSTASLVSLPTLNLSTSQAIIQPNESLKIDVRLDSATAQSLIGYELSLDVSGGDVGQLAFESITVDTLNASYALASHSTIKAVELIGNRIANLISDGLPANAPASAYLATFTLRASADAHGVFTISLPLSGRAFIIGSDAHSMATQQGLAMLIGVGMLCTDDAYCDDGNPCTDDICDPDSGCAHVNNDLNLCDNSHLCTSGVCLAGICQTSMLPSGTNCDDNLACTGLDVCDGAGTCVHDGSACAKTQTCYECPDNQYCCSTAQLPCACGEIPTSSP